MSFMFGGGGGDGQSETFYQNIIQDQQKQQALIEQQTAELKKESDKKEAEAKMLSDVEEGKRAIQRANPLPFMTTGWTGLAGMDSRTLGGNPYTLG